MGGGGGALGRGFCRPGASLRGLILDKRRAPRRVSRAAAEGGGAAWFRSLVRQAVSYLSRLLGCVSHPLPPLYGTNGGWVSYLPRDSLGGGTDHKCQFTCRRDCKKISSHTRTRSSSINRIAGGRESGRCRIPVCLTKKKKKGPEYIRLSRSAPDTRTANDI